MLVGHGTGQRYCKVKPPGCTLRYASPEQIRSLQMRHEWEYRVAKPYPEQAATTSGGHGLKSAVRKVKQAWKERKLAIAEERLLDAFCNRLEGCPISGGCHTYVDGASADSYAAGVVLYEMVSVFPMPSVTHFNLVIVSAICTLSFHAACAHR